MITLLKEIAIMCCCNYKNIAKIQAIYFNSKDTSVWIIQPKYYITLKHA